jgi:hypothetical protein
VLAAAVAMIAMRVLVPPLGLIARRALVTPFLMRCSSPVSPSASRGRVSSVRSPRR